MKRSKLKNKGNKTKNPTHMKNYKKQRHYAVQLNKKAKLEYFNILIHTKEVNLFL